MQSLKSFILARKNAMDAERQSFEDAWEDIAKFVSPRSLRWIDDDPTDRGSKKHKDIIDPSTTLAVRNCVSGLMSGMLNPSRKNWVYGTSNPDFNEDVAVRAYLADCEDIDRGIALKSNFFLEAAKFLRQSILFGTAAMFIDEDEQSVFRCETFPIGSYWIGKRGRGHINEFVRVYSDSAANIVRDFGEANCSIGLQNAAKDPKNSARFEVLHYVGPNDSFAPGRPLDPKAKRFRSVYVEYGSKSSNRDHAPVLSIDDKVLSERGYDEFPVMVHRWFADGQDSWGSDYPGLQSLGHTKELQATRRAFAKGLQKQMDPPMQASMHQRNQQVNTQPGFTNYTDMVNGGVKPLYDVRPDLNAGASYMNDIRQKISEIYFNDVFLMISQERRSGTKAREIEELSQERMMMMSPILEGFSDEFLEPAVNRIFSLVEKRGLHPVPPDSFAGQAFEVEFVNILSTTLKMQGIAALDRGIAVLGQVGQVSPDVMDLLDEDKFASIYLDRIAFDPRALRSKDEIAQRRQARAQQQQQQQMMQDAQMSAETAKTLSETKTQEDNGLTQLMQIAGAM